jgi:CHAT domain-containing protein
MSTPGPMTVKIQQIQARLNELHAQQAKTGDVLIYRPQEAYNIFKDLQGKADAIYQEYEAWTQQQVVTVHRQALDARAFMLCGQGHAAFLMGRLSEAQQIFLQALDVLGEEPGPSHTSLLAGLGNICYQQGLFEDAARYFIHAYAEGTALADNFHQQAQGIDETGTQQREWLEKMATSLWQDAAQNIGSVAMCALMQDDRAGYSRYNDEAKEFARVHGLQDLYRKFWLNELKLRIYSDATGEFIEELRKLANSEDDNTFTEDVSMRIDLKLFLAEQAMGRGGKGGFNEAEQELAEAEQLAEDKQLPFSKWSVMLVRVSFFEAQGQIDKAIQEAQDLLRMSRETNIQIYIQQALDALIRVQLQSADPVQRAQADQDIEELSKSGDNQYLAQALNARALRLTNEQRLEDAMRDIERAETCAVEGYERKQLLFAKFALLVKMGRKVDALELGNEAIRRYSEELVPPGEQLQAQWKDTLQRLESLYTTMASLLVEMDQPDYLRQAFEMAERGKAQIMRHQLAWSGQKVSDASMESFEIGFDELRSVLASESAALALFGLGESKSWVFIVDPQQPEPQYHVIDLTIDKVKNMGATDQQLKTGRDALFDALPELSKQLLPPLREVVDRNSVLYLVPSSLLYAIPFAALTFDDGSCLIEHCALACVPSLAILQWCRSRYQGISEHTCLALGVGSSGSYSFAGQAQEIVALPWSAEALLPEKTRGSELLARMQDFSVTHLACHGIVDSRRSDILLASSLVLGDQLTARQVFELNGHIHSELVFLNACLSAGFQHQMSNEVGGFWQAFLQAGATSLIATLVLVEPDSAQQLAFNFYKNWLTGKVTKAEALRQAQLKLLEDGRKPYQWASHILIGDHR